MPYITMPFPAVAVARHHNVVCYSENSQWIQLLFYSRLVRMCMHYVFALFNAQEQSLLCAVSYRCCFGLLSKYTVLQF